MMRVLLILFAGLILWPRPGLASAEAAITAGLDQIRAAALSGETEAAADLLAPDFVLISQSGTRYGRGDALLDLGSGFSAWDNRAVEIRDLGDSAAVTLINTRQRVDVPAIGRFRVLQLWQQTPDGAWQMLVQQSTRMPPPDSE